MKIVTSFEEAKELLSRRAAGLSPDVEQEKVVRQIIDEVRRRGDSALLDFTEKFDGVRLMSLEVDKTDIDRAFRRIDAALLSALELAAKRIAAFHSRQKRSLLRDNTKTNLGWVIKPLERIGVYAPGGTAPLPSSLLMTAIPAQVAGVKKIILATP